MSQYRNISPHFEPIFDCSRKHIYRHIFPLFNPQPKPFSLSETYRDFPVAASGTHTLDTIPRASTVSATNTNLNSASTITITRASSSFTHTLTYSFGSTTGTIVSKTTSTSVSWTPALTLANQIPNAVSGTCTITCDTYNGSTKIGSKTCTLTLTVPASVKPTMTNLNQTHGPRLYRPSIV